MKEIKKVQGSYEQAQPLIIGKTTVYVHTNIVQAKDEYIKLMAEKNSQLEQEVIDTQLALCDIYETIQGGV